MLGAHTYGLVLPVSLRGGARGVCLARALSRYGGPRPRTFVSMLGLTLWVASLHVYVWWRMVRQPRWPTWAARLATLLCVLFVLAYPTTFVVWFRIYSSHPLHFALVYGWLGALVYVCAALALYDATRALTWIARWAVTLSALCSDACFRVLRSRLEDARLERERASTTESAPAVLASEPSTATEGALRNQRELEAKLETRRVFMARAVAGSALLVGGAAGTYGVRAAVWDITLPEVAVALPRLPSALDGYTIALLTDIHIGQTLDGRFLRHLVEQTNRMRPDAIAIGGDLVDGRVLELGAAHVSELRNLRARDGVFYVTGNHEYFWGAADWSAFVARLGVRVLSNERVSLGDAHVAGAQFDLIGLPDLAGFKRGPVGPDIEAAAHGRDTTRELVVLAHQPIQIAASVRAGAGLQLSGHTHGGQLNPFGAVAAALSQGYVSGLHQHPSTDTKIYVSRGSGFWGPPMRVFAPAEITCIRLYRAG